MIKWFAAIKLVLNLHKSEFNEIITNNHILHFILVIKNSIRKRQ